MRIIGITGGIATGKSTVSQILREYYGVVVIDVDKISRLVVEPGTDALKKIEAEFGSDILQEDGYLDRAKLRKITVNDEEKMKVMTGIVWPEMASKTSAMMDNFRRNGIEVICVENAMLIESGNSSKYDIQLARVISRDNQSEADAQAMIDLQMSLEEKEKHASFLIVNNGSRPTLRKQIDALYRKVIRQENV